MGIFLFAQSLSKVYILLMLFFWTRPISLCLQEVSYCMGTGYSLLLLKLRFTAFCGVFAAIPRAKFRVQQILAKILRQLPNQKYFINAIRKDETKICNILHLTNSIFNTFQTSGFDFQESI